MKNNIKINPYEILNSINNLYIDKNIMLYISYKNNKLYFCTFKEEDKLYTQTYLESIQNCEPFEMSIGYAQFYLYLQKIYRKTKEISIEYQVIDIFDGESKTLKQLRIKFDNSNVTFFDQGAKIPSFIQGVNGVDYPKGFEVESKLFYKMVSKVKPSLYAKIDRYNLKGIFINYSNHKDLLFATTDTHRLSVFSNLDKYIDYNDFDKLKSIIIPIEIVNYLEKLNPDVKIDFSFCVNDRRCKICIGSLEIYNPLIDAEYPKFEYGIPLDNDIKIIFDTKKLIKIVKNHKKLQKIQSLINYQISIQNKIIMKFDKKSNYCNLQMWGMNYKIEILYSKNLSTFEYALNPKYLLDAIESIDTEHCIIELKDKKTACIVKNDDNGSFFTVIMPIRD